MGRAFEYRKATKFARWDRMAKAFTKVSKEITMAVKAGGNNPESNAALRRAIQNAKGVQMPKDKVESAIKRASTKGGNDYKTIFYDGMGPHGVAITIETATDNVNRTVANIRAIFRKKGGELGIQGMHDFIFKSKGVFNLKRQYLDAVKNLELELIDYGFESLKEELEEGFFEVLCEFKEFGTMSDFFDQQAIEVESSSIKKIPTVTVPISELDQEDEVLELIDVLEQDEDVQNVYHNLEEKGF